MADVCWVCKIGVDPDCGELVRNPGEKCTCDSSGFIHTRCIEALISASGNRVVYSPHLGVVRVFHTHAPCRQDLFLGEMAVPRHHLFLWDMVNAAAAGVRALDASQLFGVMCCCYAAWMVAECCALGSLCTLCMLAAILSPLTWYENASTATDWARVWGVVFGASVTLRLFGAGTTAETLMPAVVCTIRFIMHTVHVEWVRLHCVAMMPTALRRRM